MLPSQPGLSCQLLGLQPALCMDPAQHEVVSAWSSRQLGRSPNPGWVPLLLIPALLCLPPPFSRLTGTLLPSLCICLGAIQVCWWLCNCNSSSQPCYSWDAGEAAMGSCPDSPDAGSSPNPSPDGEGVRRGHVMGRGSHLQSCACQLWAHVWRPLVSWVVVLLWEHTDDQRATPALNVCPSACHSYWPVIWSFSLYLYRRWYARQLQNTYSFQEYTSR